MEKNMRVAFLGTPVYAAENLNKIIETQNVVGVVTQPDRPAGRGHKVNPTPVKAVALEHGLPLIQPETINTDEVIEIIRSWNPDIILIVAFGQLIKKELLDMPKYGCVNAHFSLLPKYRGAAPVPWSIVKGEKETGITFFKLVPAMDAGDILLQVKTEISDFDTTTTLGQRLCTIAAESWQQLLVDIKTAAISPRPQDHSLATYAPKLAKNDGVIDWNMSNKNIDCFVRGMTPYPGAFTYYYNNHSERERLIIRDATPAATNANVFPQPGEIARVGENAVLVGTGNGLVKLNRVQPSNRKAMDAIDFIHGHQIKIGSVLG